MTAIVDKRIGIDEVNADIISASQISPSSATQEKPRISYGLHTVKDSLAPASATSVDPTFNPGFYLIGLQNDTEAVNRQDILLSKSEIEVDLEELKKLNDEKIAALKEHAIKVNSAATWDAIKNVASYFAFATSTLVGATACVNPTLSALLIGSGAVGLVNRVLSDTGVWKSIASYFVKEEQTQEKVASYVDYGFSIATTGIGLFNVVGGAYFGVDTLLANGSWQIVKQAGYYGSTILSMVSTYKEAETKSKVHKSESVLSTIEGKQVDLSNSLKSKTANVEQTVRHNSKLIEGVHTTIKSMIDNLRKLTDR
jgi:hypothetical protein